MDDAARAADKINAAVRGWIERKNAVRLALHRAEQKARNKQRMAFRKISKGGRKRIHGGRAYG